MLANYQNLSENSRVFVYPSSRKFYPNELASIDAEVKEFVMNWTEFSTSYKIEYNRFILIFLEEDAVASTELLDKLAAFIFQLEKKKEITLMDKVNVCFKQGQYVQYQEMKRFRELIKSKSVSNKTIVFNNFIQTKYDFENQWEVPISESWLSHLIK
ncbi:MAG TPA: ABC transporter ATPase [Flavobacteriaceae bacterium]|nr:ABC transporter ATPase [Flavobacteriaceae bacterium]HIP26889.1 ABC transporter ATPase [Flavobacteriaceae bacterium]